VSQIAAGGEEGDSTMTQGFQQQDAALNFCIPKSVATPQHGQKAGPQKPQPAPERRSFEPRPGH